MKNELGVPVPGWTVVASWTGWIVVTASAATAVRTDYTPKVLVAVVPLVVVSVLLLVRARAGAAESRRQTAVVRGALGYRWGERPRSWRWHAGLVAAVIYSAAVQLWVALDDGSIEGMVFAVLYASLIGGVVVLSAVQKWRYRSRSRRTPAGQVELRAAPPPPPQGLSPQPVRGA